MSDANPRSFDPATLQVLRSVLDAVWDGLPPERQAQVPKATLAARILSMAGQVDFSPDRLKAELEAELANTGTTGLSTG
jgi:hypothetical protein